MLRAIESTKPFALLVLSVWLYLFMAQAGATSVRPVPLEEIVAQSDHVVAARVVRVDMIDGNGRPVRDREARTGPGLYNRIRFHLEIDNVLLTNCRRTPRRILVPLWQMWHYSLGTMQDEVEGTDGIFLLKGTDFEPAYPQDFQRELGERQRIEPLVNALRLQRKPSQVSCQAAPTAR